MERRSPSLEAPHKRPDPRTEATRHAIIEAAESLFGRESIDSVSLRQIGLEIGAGNTAVVSYHFGDKEALIEAILLHRLPQFETRRAELLSTECATKPAVDSLLRALWLPLFEQRNTQGRRSYAAFLGSLGRSRWGWVWSARDAPVAVKISESLAELMPASARRFYWERILACTALVTTAIGTIDAASDLEPRQEMALFEDAISMAAAALCAPGA